MSLGARGTPAFFINGRYLSVAQPFANFERLIDEELKKAKAKTELPDKVKGYITLRDAHLAEKAWDTFLTWTQNEMFKN